MSKEFVEVEEGKMIEARFEELFYEQRETIALIRGNYRKREDYMGARNKMVNQVKSICRRYCGGDKKLADKLYEHFEGKKLPKNFPVTEEALVEARMNCSGIFEVISMLNIPKEHYEKLMATAVKKSLHIWPWVEGVKGLGAVSAAKIVGETGDLFTYSGPAKVWKRMGLAVINGGRQRKVAKDTALAIEHGYSPRRRSVMHVTCECLLRAKGDYYQLYLDREETEWHKAKKDGLTPMTAKQKTVDSWERRGLPPLMLVADGKFDKNTHRTATHLNFRAQRFVLKRLLREMWRAWHREV